MTEQGMRVVRRRQRRHMRRDRIEQVLLQPPKLRLHPGK
jgi:hypothetical protein